MPNTYIRKLKNFMLALIRINKRHPIRRLYGRSENAIPALADLSIIEDDVWDDSYGITTVVAARIECMAPRGLVRVASPSEWQLAYLLALL